MSDITNYDPNVYIVRAVEKTDAERIFGPVSRDAAETLLCNLALHGGFAKVRLEMTSRIPDGSAYELEGSTALRYRLNEKRTREVAREEARQVLAAWKATRQ